MGTFEKIADALPGREGQRLVQSVSLAVVGLAVMVWILAVISRALKEVGGLIRNAAELPLPASTPAPTPAVASVQATSAGFRPGPWMIAAGVTILLAVLLGNRQQLLEVLWDLEELVRK